MNENRDTSTELVKINDFDNTTTLSILDVSFHPTEN
jgi:hypothetical protein